MESQMTGFLSVVPSSHSFFDRKISIHSVEFINSYIRM